MTSAGIYGNESIEIPVNEIHRLNSVDENKFGCSDDKNVGKAILPLFAFSFLKKLEIQFKNKTISDEIKVKAVEVSLVSGVLCRYTGYDELTKKANDQFIGIYDQSNDPFAAQSRNESTSNDPFAAQYF